LYCHIRGVLQTKEWQRQLQVSNGTVLNDRWGSGARQKPRARRAIPVSTREVIGGKANNKGEGDRQPVERGSIRAWVKSGRLLPRGPGEEFDLICKTSPLKLTRKTRERCGVELVLIGR